MAVGIYVYIGINMNTRPTDSNHADPRTVAQNEDECQMLIDQLNLTLTHYPSKRLLILKGRMSDG